LHGSYGAKLIMWVELVSNFRQSLQINMHSHVSLDVKYWIALEL